MAKARKYSELRDQLMKQPGAIERKLAARKRLQKRLERHAATLAEIRRARQVTQVELARQMNFTQPEISRIEKQPDVLLSTMRAYIEAMGGELELVAKFDDEPEISISIGEVIGS